MLRNFFNYLTDSFNCFYLNYKHAQIGKDSHFYGKTCFSIFNGANISIGNNFISRSGFGNHILGGGVTNIQVQRKATLRIGNNSGIACTAILCDHNITIGNFVNIGAGSIIMDTNFHSLDWEKRGNRAVDKDKSPQSVVIGDYAFIGAKAIITKGVTIGCKSIVAAGSVVVKNIPPNEMWGGNPAKFIKKI